MNVASVTSPGSDLSSDMSSITLSASGAASARSSQPEPSIGRGATRGRRDRAPEFLVRTRSDKLTSKKGSGGVDTKLTANYFSLIAKPNWK